MSPFARANQNPRVAANVTLRSFSLFSYHLVARESSDEFIASSHALFKRLYLCPLTVDKALQLPDRG